MMLRKYFIIALMACALGVLAKEVYLSDAELTKWATAVFVGEVQSIVPIDTPAKQFHSPPGEETDIFLPNTASNLWMATIKVEEIRKEHPKVGKTTVVYFEHPPNGFSCPPYPSLSVRQRAVFYTALVTLPGITNCLWLSTPSQIRDPTKPGPPVPQ